jgi:multimeric flavodoxin WrbA
MRATALNCTLKRSPQASNTEALTRVMIDALEEMGVECDLIRLVDLDIPVGVESDLGEGDPWPRVREAICSSEILVLASPTWLGQPASICKVALERMDAMLAETDDDGRPIAYGRVAGIVVTGNEDGAHHVISEVAGALNDIGFTIPGQAWTYWNRGPGPGKDYSETEDGHEWSHSTARTAAANLVAVAQALAAHPISPPPSD